MITVLIMHVEREAMMLSQDRADDIAVAVEILGWTNVRAADGRIVGHAPQPLGGDTAHMRQHGFSVVPRFGEYFDPAMMVISGMRAKGWNYDIRGDAGSEGHTVRFGRGMYVPDIDEYMHQFFATDTALPLAIRSAALAAIRAFQSADDCR